MTRQSHISVSARCTSSVLIFLVCLPIAQAGKLNTRTQTSLSSPIPSPSHFQVCQVRRESKPQELEQNLPVIYSACGLLQPACSCIGLARAHSVYTWSSSPACQVPLLRHVAALEQVAESSPGFTALRFLEGTLCLEHVATAALS